MSYDLVLRGGQAVLPGQAVTACDIAVRGGRILAIGAAVVSHNASHIFKSLAKQTISQLPTIIAYALAVVFCVLAIVAGA